jgi:hypothetical protein
LPHPELEAFRSDQTDQILPAGEQAEPWPYPSDEMICWPVSARVGNVKNNDPSDRE